MTPKHSLLDSKTSDKIPAKSSGYTPKHAKVFTAKNSEIIITKGNPTESEIAVIAALFTVLSTRSHYLNQTVDHWPSPDCDAGMRGPFGTFTKYRTNLRWW